MLKAAVLDLLKQDARLGNAEIATRVGVSESEVASEILRLEKERIVLGYRAIINPEKLEDEECLAIIELKITPQRDVGYDEIAAQIYKFPEVKLCYLISGNYDLLVFVEARNMRDAASFVSQKLATVDKVTGTTTHFILKKYKESGIVMGDEEKLDRLPISP